MKLSMHRHFILLAIAILFKLNKVGSSRRRWQSNGKCDVNVIFNTGNVNCGSHLAKTCSQCPCNEQGVFQDNSWCGGECQWSGSRFKGVCQMRQKAAKCAAVIFNRGNVNCGGHRAKTCSLCPCTQQGGYASDWCKGDCQWRGDHLSGVCLMRQNITKGEWHSWDTSIEGR